VCSVLTVRFRVRRYSALERLVKCPSVASRHPGLSEGDQRATWTAATMADATSAPSANMAADLAVMRRGFSNPPEPMAFTMNSTQVRAAAYEMPRISSPAGTPGPDDFEGRRTGLRCRRWDWCVSCRHRSISECRRRARTCMRSKRLIFGRNTPSSFALSRRDSSQKSFERDSHTLPSQIVCLAPWQLLEPPQATQK